MAELKPFSFMLIIVLIAGTISKEVRKKVGVEVGDKLRVVEKGELIVLKKVSKKKSLLEYAGCWKGYPEKPDEFMRELRELWST